MRDEWHSEAGLFSRPSAQPLDQHNGTGTMRRGLWLVSLMLPLAGCYVAPSDPEYGYAQPGYPSPPSGYPPPGYPPPAYPPGAYAPAPYDPNAGTYAPGYGYNGGAPVIVEGGMAMPLVLFG